MSRLKIKCSGLDRCSNKLVSTSADTELLQDDDSGRYLVVSIHTDTSARSYIRVP